MIGGMDIKIGIIIGIDQPSNDWRNRWNNSVGPLRVSAYRQDRCIYVIQYRHSCDLLFRLFRLRARLTLLTGVVSGRHSTLGEGGLRVDYVYEPRWGQP